MNKIYCAKLLLLYVLNVSESEQPFIPTVGYGTPRQVCFDAAKPELEEYTHWLLPDCVMG
jgi:hypothetical protein